MVILGAGHAGGTAAALLRQYGHEGPITLIGEEPLPPYQRPPLSKAWLKGEADADSLALKPVEFYAEHGIDFRPSVRAVALRASRTARHASCRGVMAFPPWTDADIEANCAGLSGRFSGRRSCRGGTSRGPSPAASASTSSSASFARGN